VGQFVSRGSPIGRLYAVDYAEIRLPIPDEQLAFIDLPLARRDDASLDDAPRVRVRARFAGANHTWEGRIVRTEGEIDRRSRMVHAVARVEDPYGLGADGKRAPLAVGLFVEAEIQGHLARGATVLPRSALRDGNRVWVVDADDRLRFREVDVLRVYGSEVVIRDGLRQGERVCVSPLLTVVDGMQVRALGPPAQPAEQRL
jgi:multidrug efflux pump subunit AcrA (membrane-fusion protein)